MSGRRRAPGPILGAHQSIAGGYHRALESGARLGCQCVQIFTKNSNQWRAKPIAEAEAERFHAARAATGIEHVAAHDSYLINLASPDEALWRRSLEAFVEELRRAAQLGIPWVVMHPGASTTSSPEAGLQRVIQALDLAHAATRGLPVGTLLETTAGQGTSLGYRFEQLATLLGGARDSDRLGVCVDTCHLFAAGYELAPRRAFLATFRALDKAIGVERVGAFHLNDSKTPRGSRVDRHEHIGRGRLGLEPFRLLLADPRFRGVPMYLETEKGTHEGREWDAINLETLRSLSGGDAAP